MQNKILVNKGDSLIEFQKKVVTPKLYLAHFLFMQEIQGFRKGHTVLKINYLKSNFGQTKDKFKGRILV